MRHFLRLTCFLLLSIPLLGQGQPPQPGQGLSGFVPIDQLPLRQTRFQRHPTSLPPTCSSGSRRFSIFGPFGGGWTKFKAKFGRSSVKPEQASF
jgi:hypothetical protein